MPAFGKRSLDRLATCDIRLQIVMQEVIKHYDITVIEGFRDQIGQNKAVESGTSNLRWPNSLHNRTPSLAVDVAPYPIDWNDTARFYYMAGMVMALASHMNIRLRWGGDWNRDNDLHNQRLYDLGHFEIVE